MFLIFSNGIFKLKNNRGLLIIRFLFVKVKVFTLKRIYKHDKATSQKQLMMLQHIIEFTLSEDSGFTHFDSNSGNDNAIIKTAPIRPNPIVKKLTLLLKIVVSISFFVILLLTSRRLYEVAEFLLLMFTNIPKRLKEKSLFRRKKCKH